jgi:hypothetical protein
MRPNPMSRRILTALLCVTPQAPLLAQSAPAPQLATKEEYRACRLSRTELDERKSRLDARVERHNQALAVLQADSNAFLKSPQGKSPRADMAAYNKVVDALNARTREVNREQTEIRKEGDAFNANVVDVNLRCASQVVENSVAEEVDRELGGPPK